jgi:serine protease Do
MHLASRLLLAAFALQASHGLAETSVAVSKGSSRNIPKRPLIDTASDSGPLAELLDVQHRVQIALASTESALVALECNGEAASGIIVSPTGLVMTAAHVVLEHGEMPKTGRRMKVFCASGFRTMGTALGADTAADAGMLQLDGERRDWPCVPLAKGNKAEVQVGDWCFALGHPGGLDTSRGPVLRVGKILKTTANSLQTDCVLMGGDSGGPLFDVEGALIGIHSQIWEGRDQNVHVSLAPFLRHWQAMRESQIISTWGQGHGGYLGIATRLSEGDRLEVADVAPGSPAALAGLRTGDTIESADGRRMTTREQFTNSISNRSAGDHMVLVINNRSGNRIVTVTLTGRPEE